MNKTKIGWSDYSWNPITGCSLRCEYCYAKRFAERLAGRAGYPLDDPFRPTFHEDKLRDPEKVKRPGRVFTCSMGEIFDPMVDPEWLRLIFDEMRRCPQHTFLILTKQPQELRRHEFPDNCWVGVTVDVRSRLGALDLLRASSARVKFVSFEPLLEPLEPNLEGIDWVIIGGKTGVRPFIPPREWAQTIINNARQSGCAVFLKENLEWTEIIREFPTRA